MTVTKLNSEAVDNPVAMKRLASATWIFFLFLTAGLSAAGFFVGGGVIGQPQSSCASVAG